MSSSLLSLPSLSRQTRKGLFSGCALILFGLEEPPPGPGPPLLSEDDVLDPRLVGRDLRVDAGHVPPAAPDAKTHDAHLV